MLGRGWETKEREEGKDKERKREGGMQQDLGLGGWRRGEEKGGGKLGGDWFREGSGYPWDVPPVLCDIGEASSCTVCGQECVDAFVRQQTLRCSANRDKDPSK
jgi:hypothetical protein